MPQPYASFGLTATTLSNDPLVVYSKNPAATPQQNHYPTPGPVLALTAVKVNRPGRVPVLTVYDPLDPGVVRSAAGPDPIVANYTAPLAVLLSHGRQVANSAAGAFLRPDNPRFATGIYLIPPYDPRKIPV